MHYDIKCNELSNADIKQISELHVKYLETGFLSQLGSEFLFYLYLSMRQSQEAALIIAKHNDEVIGFVSGASSLKPIYNSSFGVQIHQNHPSLPHHSYSNCIVNTSN